MGREVTRAYRPTVRSDFNESYHAARVCSGRVTKKKIRKRDTMIKKPSKSTSGKKPMVNNKTKLSVPDLKFLYISN